MIMKNEKYIAPEMEVVDVKMNAVLMDSNNPTLKPAECNEWFSTTTNE